MIDWISVEERLPKHDVEVRLKLTPIVNFIGDAETNGFIFRNKYYGTNDPVFWSTEISDMWHRVTHWAEINEPEGKE